MRHDLHNCPTVGIGEDRSRLTRGSILDSPTSEQAAFEAGHMWGSADMLIVKKSAKRETASKVPAPSLPRRRTVQSRCLAA